MPLPTSVGRWPGVTAPRWCLGSVPQAGHRQGPDQGLVARLRWTRATSAHDLDPVRRNTTARNTQPVRTRTSQNQNQHDPDHPAGGRSGVVPGGFPGRGHEPRAGGPRGAAGRGGRGVPVAESAVAPPGPIPNPVVTRRSAGEYCRGDPVGGEAAAGTPRPRRSRRTAPRGRGWSSSGRECVRTGSAGDYGPDQHRRADAGWSSGSSLGS